MQSNRKFYWKCSKDHSWQISPAHRARGHSCPYCAGQIVMVSFNDLESQFPEISNEWNYEKNEVKPSEVTSKSYKKYNWICQKCGHS